MANASGFHSVFNFSSHLGSSDGLLLLNINETNFEMGKTCGFFFKNVFVLGSHVRSSDGHILVVFLPMFTMFIF
jgi:hypothetical protein